MLYPIGIQNFSEIRTRGFAYVDKTAAVYALAATGKYYFLSRPRRFGKSLLISTMEAYFSGKKELFNGLAMEALEKDWATYPVLHLDLTGSAYTSVSDLKERLELHLSRWEEIYGKVGDFTDTASRFDSVIESAVRKTGKKVVILIDEYEKPIVDNIDAPELMERFRRELQGFYSVIKGKDECIRFVFLTGVTKLGKMSIFSGLNNLNDISMDLRYADISADISFTDWLKLNLSSTVTYNVYDLNDYLNSFEGPNAGANGTLKKSNTANLRTNNVQTLTFLKQFGRWPW